MFQCDQAAKLMSSMPKGADWRTPFGLWYLDPCPEGLSGPSGARLVAVPAKGGPGTALPSYPDEGRDDERTERRAGHALGTPDPQLHLSGCRRPGPVREGVSDRHDRGGCRLRL